MPRPATAMPRPKSDNTLQLTFMTSEDVRVRLDGMAKRMSAAVPAGIEVTRADVLRTAVEEGLKVLEQHFPPPPRKR